MKHILCEAFQWILFILALPVIGVLAVLWWIDEFVVLCLE